MLPSILQSCFQKDIRILSHKVQYVRCNYIRDLVNTLQSFLLLKSIFFVTSATINISIMKVTLTVGEATKFNYFYCLLIKDTDEESFSFIFVQLWRVTILQFSGQTLVAFKQLAMCQHLVVHPLTVFCHILSLHVQHSALQLQSKLRRWAWWGGRWGHAHCLV